MLKRPVRNFGKRKCPEQIDKRGTNAALYPEADLSVAGNKPAFIRDDISIKLLPDQGKMPNIPPDMSQKTAPTELGSGEHDDRAEHKTELPLALEASLASIAIPDIPDMDIYSHKAKIISLQCLGKHGDEFLSVLNGDLSGNRISRLELDGEWNLVSLCGSHGSEILPEKAHALRAARQLLLYSESEEKGFVVDLLAAIKSGRITALSGRSRLRLFVANLKKQIAHAGAPASD